jgi:uncharacterized protein YqgC (DUF456 family)
MVFVVAGMSASAVLTGRKLKQHGIPSRSVVVGLIAGVIGMFIIPFVGLFVGFAAGLLLSELRRTRKVSTATTTSWAALKATGLGMLAEFGLACLAASTWVIGLWVTAVT